MTWRRKKRDFSKSTKTSAGPSFARSRRPTFFSTRKGIYEQLHPETKHGANLVSPNWRHEENADESPSTERAPSFVDDTATSTPWSPRTIQRYTRIGERLDPELREATCIHPHR